MAEETETKKPSGLETIYVKQKDHNNSLYIQSQRKSVNGKRIVEVLNNYEVNEALEGKSIVKVTKKEYEEQNLKRKELLEINSDKKQAIQEISAGVESTKSTTAKLLIAAVNKNVIVFNGISGYKFSGTVIGKNKDEAIEWLESEENADLVQKIQASVSAE